MESRKDHQISFTHFTPVKSNSNSLVLGPEGEVIFKDIKHHGHLGENEHSVFALVQFSQQLVKYLQLPARIQKPFINLFNQIRVTYLHTELQHKCKLLQYFHQLLTTLNNKNVNHKIMIMCIKNKMFYEVSIFSFTVIKLFQLLCILINNNIKNNQQES